MQQDCIDGMREADPTLMRQRQCATGHGYGTGGDPFLASRVGTPTRRSGA